MLLLQPLLDRLAHYLVIHVESVQSLLARRVHYLAIHVDSKSLHDFLLEYRQSGEGLYCFFFRYGAEKHGVSVRTICRNIIDES